MPTIVDHVKVADWAALTPGTVNATQMGVGSIGGTWTLVDSGGVRWVNPPLSGGNMRFTTFGGATDPITGSAVIGTQTLRVMFPSLYDNSTNNDEVLRLTIGTGNRFISFRRVKRDGNQQGIRIFIGTTGVTDANQPGSINDANNGLPVLELDRIYDITARLSYTATGYLALYIDGQYAGRVTADMTADTSLNSSNQFRNWNWEPHKTGTFTAPAVRFYPAMIHTDELAENDWYNTHFPLTPTVERPDPLPMNEAVAEVGFPQTWCAQPLPTNGTPVEGHELGMTLVSGTPTVAVTPFSTAGVNPLKNRLVFSSASAGNTVLVYGTDRRKSAANIGDCPSLNGWRTLCFSTEYAQNSSSAIYAIFPQGTNPNVMATTTPLLAVRIVGVSSRLGHLVEGTSVNGRVLCSIDPNKRYTIALQWNQTTGETRVVVIDLTSAQPGDADGAGSGYSVALLGQPTVFAAALRQTWPIGVNAGPWSARYILGGSASEGLSMVTAGPFSLAFGDSYTSDRALASSGPDVQVAPVLTSLANNFFSDMSIGQFSQMHRRGFRPSKQWGLNDIVWLTTVARSGGRIEDFVDANLEEVAEIRGAYGFICGYAYNSLVAIDATNREATLARIVEKTSRLIATWINRDNVMYYVLPPALRANGVGGTVSSTNFGRAGAQWALASIGPQVIRAVAALSTNTAMLNLRVADGNDIGNTWMADSADSVHPTGGTYGNRWAVSAMFPGLVRAGAPSLFVDGLTAIASLEQRGTARAG